MPSPRSRRRSSARWRFRRQAVGFVGGNQDKIDYPRHRREGLPISSAPVESLIREVNLQVKGSKRFWTSAGLEAVLQVRAAHLSAGGRAEAH